MKRSNMEMDDRKIMITAFIECYRSKRILWDPNYEHTRKIGARYAKERAYGELAAVMRPFRKNATIEDAKRQINTIRSTYRKECYKILASEGSDSPYKCGIWWFNLMRFIKYGLKDDKESDNNEADERDEDNDGDGDSTYKMKITIPEQVLIQTKSKQPVVRLSKIVQNTPAEESDDYENYEMLDDFIDNQVDESNDKREYISEENEQHTSDEVETEENEFEDDTESDEDETSDHCNYPSNKRRKYEDCFFYLSKVWADKLRKISSTQFILAEKAINDVLFNAEMGVLSHHTGNYVVDKKYTNNTSATIEEIGSD